MSAYDSFAAAYKVFSETQLLFRSKCTFYTFFQAIGRLARSSSVLDLGCGTGHLGRECIRLGARDVFGVDGSAEQLRIAKQFDEAEKISGIQYQQEDLSDLPVLGSFDIVAAILVMNYASDVDTLGRWLRRIYDNLAPGGIFATVMISPYWVPSEFHLLEKYGRKYIAPNGQPSKDGDPFEWMCFANGQWVQDPIQETYWSRETIEVVLKDAGYTRVRWEPIRVDPETRASDPGYWSDIEGTRFQVCLVAEKESGGGKSEIHHHHFPLKKEEEQHN